MNTNVFRKVLKFVVIAVVIGFLVYAFLPERVSVDTITVKKGGLVIAMEGEGKTRIHDIYTVSTPMEGRVTRIEIEPGDLVKAGQTTIANMYPANPRFLDKRTETQAKADVEGAKAALSLAHSRVKQTKAQLAFDLAEYKRTQKLYKNKNVSKAGLERAELQLKTLRAELETAESNKQVMQSRLNAADARLLQPDKNQDKDNDDENCQICIHSPVDGRILRILHKSEGIVPIGTPLVEVGDPSDLEAVIEMLSTNAVKIKVGDEALIKRWGGNQDIHAVVKVIEPSGYTKISALGVEEQRVNIILRFTDPRDKWLALGDAFRVEAAIIIDQATDVIKIPLSALFRHNEEWSVFKVVEGVVELQSVDVGRRNDRFAEVVSGLLISEKIIIHPGNTISEGVKVKN